MAFKVRGQAGGEFIGFEIQNDSSPPTGVSLGNIFEFLPLGITTDWQQVVLAISPQLSAALPRATSLIVRSLEEQKGVVFLKDLSFLPRIKGTEGWDTLAVSLREHGLSTLDDFSLLVLDHYEGVGTRVGRILGKDKPGFPVRTFVGRGEVPRFQDDYFLVTDFDEGRPNSLHGYFGAFQHAPSSIQIDLDAEIRRGDGGKSLRGTYSKKGEGFCGFWVHLFETKKPPRERVYFDATPFHYLSFWVKGAQGDEDVTVQVADSRWERREDSVPLAPVSEILTSGVSSEWQEVVIPLNKPEHRNLDFTRLASITFNFRRPGSGAIYIDDVTFKTSPEARVPETLPSSAKAERKMFRYATWIWDPTPYLDNETERQELFRFSENQGIDILFLQTQCLFRKVRGEETCRLEREGQLRSFIREAHGHGIEVHALDGYSYHVLPPWRAKVYAQVQAVIEYNAKVPPEERFAGIHHDNEPYLIPSFSGLLKEQLLLYFLDLTYACQQLVKQAGGGLVYGVDIPFWYDERDEQFTMVGAVTWQGVRKPASFHVIDIVDNVGVMAYRTYAYGADGVIALASNEIKYANNRGKQVFVALETGPVPKQTKYYFTSASRLTESDTVVPNEGAYLLIDEWEGFAILYLKEFGAKLGAEGTPPSLGPLPGTGNRKVFRSVRKIVVPSTKLSFAQFQGKDVEAVIEELIDEFRDDASFAGVAVHDYESYRELSRK
ncbi:hypothetical protein MYX77_04465 [Acidobacteriia bacterium AH_259_A11_L15]|nr:hypothetical protein [Acidobacteriia bacterium AH_259_A11_L15]